jgi:hypothetical protein
MNLFAMWKYSTLARKRRLSVGFDFLDLIANKLIVPKHSFNITGSEKGISAA